MTGIFQKFSNACLAGGLMHILSVFYLFKMGKSKT